jgi:hypothetical protein
VSRLARLERLAATARAMRTAQARYFATRRREDLLEARALEGQVDTLLAELAVGPAPDPGVTRA